MKNIQLLLIFIFLIHFSYAQNVGINNTNPQASLDINGDFITRGATINIITTPTNDLNTLTPRLSFYNLTLPGGPTSFYSITGLTGGVDGREVKLYNSSDSKTIILLQQQMSLPQNQFYNTTGQDFTLQPQSIVTLRYMGTDNKWHLVSSFNGLATPRPFWGTFGSYSPSANIYMLNSANVGIGTATPTAKLQVNGSFKLTDGTQGTNKVLTSDAGGGASWQTNSIAASGNVGFGSWGDCSMNNISDYNPATLNDGQAGDNFGSSVAISGNFAIAGAPLDDGSAGADQGSATIFFYNGTNWVQQQKLELSDAAAGDNFGLSVSIDGNYACVGAYYDDGPAGLNQGSVTVFYFDGTNWVQQQKLFMADGSANDEFGVSVSISGNNIIAGSQWDSGPAGLYQGSAVIFNFNGTNWLQQQKLLLADAAAQDKFGNGVSIKNNYCIVGAQGDNVAPSVFGSATVFFFNGTSWVEQQKLWINTTTLNNFGRSVSIYDNYAIVGALNDFGTFSGEGSATIYFYNGTSWNEVNRFYMQGAQANDQFGSAVNISPNFAIIGAQSDDDIAGINQGTAVIYKNIGNNYWQPFQKIKDPGAFANDKLGTSVAFDNSTNRFILGNPGGFSGKGKVIFGKIN
jgi:FG-GAP repeat